MNRPEINVTPLIDVLLVLLIIFMVITPTKPSSFEARIPSEPRNIKGVEPDPMTLVVSVNPDSSLSLNTADLRSTVEAPERLIEKLKSVFEDRTRNLAFAYNPDPGVPPRIEKTVFIKAPRSLDYGSVAKVIDAVKYAGAYPVSLQIDNIGQ